MESDTWPIGYGVTCKFDIETDKILKRRSSGKLRSVDTCIFTSLVKHVKNYIVVPCIYPKLLNLLQYTRENLEPSTDVTVSKTLRLINFFLSHICLSFRPFVF
jgi:hypothetical protein